MKEEKGATAERTDANETSEQAQEATEHRGADRQQNTAEEKKKKRGSLSLISILGGEFLATDFLRRQTRLIVLIMVLVIFYIHNRYVCQQKQIEIDQLKKELIDIKYDALTRSSELMEKSRQSRIEEYISNKESDLQTSTHPPYLIE